MRRCLAWCQRPTAPRIQFALLLAQLIVAVRVPAQVRPDLEWRTLQGEHVRVHFDAVLEPLARRTLANAEWAYSRLSAEIKAPRGWIDIVVADNVDFANGYATPYPSNRIVVYARPPIDAFALRNHADWNRILVTHEMAHMFHLDRVGGVWRLGQWVFGRAAPLFPNSYAPSWLLEGLAVHYETHLTGAGRLAGSEFPAYARALATGAGVPPIDALSATRPYFPGGQAPYLFGAYIMDRALRTDSVSSTAERAERLIARSSSRLNPWRLDASARAALGETFTVMYDAWRDSLRRDVACTNTADCAVAGVVDTAALPHLGWDAAAPRFAPDGSIHVTANNTRSVPGLFVVDGRAQPRRVGRRNSVDVSAPLDRERSLHAELDFTDPYTLRSDLYLASGRKRRRLSLAERLSHPDVHVASGRVVAVRSEPGTTDLVWMDTPEAMPRTLAVGTLDRVWSEPRWSHDGTRLAASLWERGGQMSIVVLDTTGRELQRFSPRSERDDGRLAMVTTPAWAPGDSLLLFASDHRSGQSEIFVGDLRNGRVALAWSEGSLLRWPDVSPDGEHLLALALVADGWTLRRTSLATALARAGRGMAEAATTLPAAATMAAMPAATDTSEGVLRYAPTSTLGPTWWLPAMDQSDEGNARVGLLTGGSDVVGRHAWQANLRRDVARPELSMNAVYTYAGFGNPVLSLGLDRDWVHGGIQNQSGALVGILSRVTNTLVGSVYLARPRVRLSSYLLLAPEVAFRSYRTTPSGLLSQLSDPEYRDTDVLPRLAIVAGFSSLQRPALSVSTEDGIAGRLLLRRRFTEGLGATATDELLLELNAAKSLPLPGFAHHVLAARAALGTSSGNNLSYFDVGGVSGAALEVVPGVAIGDSRRAFFVRGFPAESQIGRQAAAGSLEYRAPLWRVGRGIGLVPVALQKLSLLGFADVGAAWCTVQFVESYACATAPTWMRSVGGELSLDAALRYDQLYRIRLGVARPVAGQGFAARPQTFYLTFGSTF